MTLGRIYFWHFQHECQAFYSLFLILSAQPFYTYLHLHSLQISFQLSFVPFHSYFQTLILCLFFHPTLFPSLFPSLSLPLILPHIYTLPGLRTPVPRLTASLLLMGTMERLRMFPINPYNHNANDDIRNGEHGVVYIYIWAFMYIIVDNDSIIFAGSLKFCHYIYVYIYR